MRGCASRFHRCILTAKTAQTPSQAFCPHVQKVKRGHRSQTWSIPSGSPPACFSALTSNTNSPNSSFQSYVFPSSLVKISNNLDKSQCSLLIFPHLLAHQSQCSSVLYWSSECLCTPVSLCLSLQPVLVFLPSVSSHSLSILSSSQTSGSFTQPVGPSPLLLLPKLLTLHLAISGWVASPLHSCGLKDCLQTVLVLSHHGCCHYSQCLRFSI